MLIQHYLHMHFQLIAGVHQVNQEISPVKSILQRRFRVSQISRDY